MSPDREGRTGLGDSRHSPPHLPRPVVLIQASTSHSFLPHCCLPGQASLCVVHIHGDSHAGYLPSACPLSIHFPTAHWDYFPKAVPPRGAGAKGPPPHTEALKCSRSPNCFSRSPTAETILLPLPDEILLIFDIPLPPKSYSMGLVISQF